MVGEARKHFYTNPTDLEILSEIQHYGGKTNLIDFSKNFLIALFFACDGNFREDGQLICLNAEDYNSNDADAEKYKIDIEDNIKNITKELPIEPRSKNSRVIFKAVSLFIIKKGYKKDKLKFIAIKKKDK